MDFLSKSKESELPDDVRQSRRWAFWGLPEPPRGFIFERFLQILDSFGRCRALLWIRFGTQIELGRSSDFDLLESSDLSLGAQISISHGAQI